MPTNFEEAFQKVKSLAETFLAHKDRFCSSDYKEADVRLDFIDPFLDALGWKRGQNPYQLELKVERHAQSGTQARADYAFYIAPHCSDGDERFFLEAKKPHDNIATPANYFQTISYGYSSRTPLAVLTDFEQFHILDCRYEPKLKTALDHCVDSFDYTDYLDREKFAKIYWLFSREAFTSGSFDTTVKQLRGKKTLRAPKPVDESLLERLDELRIALAHAFKKNNPELDSEALTEFAQRTLDRLVFLRFLEDKGIERQGTVSKLASSATAWRDFIARCRQLDSIYNGIIYRQQSTLDAPTFRMDNFAFAEVCKRLAHGDSDYNFNFDFIPIHVLGSIYERFLGKVIVATDKRVRIEDKPEVRKAGGVYYTPDYIVHYIVGNTVGTLIAGKTPDQIAEMRFADIACGSGSFLLGIYDLLLTYHGTWYNANRSKVRKGDCFEHDGKLYLSLAKKRDILVKNIYGVDIDFQAVEVCQLSLCLKLLKEESPETTAQYLLDFEHTAQMKKLLPDLSKNIVCGNSLIGRDILDGQLFAGEEERKLNPMNFENAFPQIFGRKPGLVREAASEYSIARSIGREGGRIVYPDTPADWGGFDVVVGNPPYIRIQTMQETSPASVKYLANHYRAAAKGNYDIYVVFAERALSLLNSHGTLGYILPHKFFNSQYGAPVRQLLSLGKHVSHVVHFGAQQVFAGATTYTCLLFLNKDGVANCRYVNVADLDAWKKGNGAVEGTIAAEQFTGGEWNFTVGRHSGLCERLRKMPVRLGDAADIFVGLQTSADDVFILDLVEEKRQTLRLHSKILDEDRTLEKGLLFPLVSGTDVRGYGALPRRQYIIFPYRVTDERAELLDFAAVEKQYPKTAAYLLENKKRLAERENGRFNDREWYRFGRSQNLGIQSRVKLCVPRLVNRLHAAWDTDGDYFLDNVDVGGVTLKPEYQDHGLQYLLALLNSRLMAWYFPFVSAPFRGGWMSANRQFLSQLPFCPVNFSKASEKSTHGEIVAKVTAMLAAKTELAGAKTYKDKTYYENKCADLDRQIDALVYELYGLTEDEIKIVEGKA